MDDYRVIIAGCRNFYNYVTLKERCEYYLQNKMITHNVIIVSGHGLTLPKEKVFKLLSFDMTYNKREKKHE